MSRDLSGDLAMHLDWNRIHKRYLSASVATRKLNIYFDEARHENVLVVVVSLIAIVKVVRDRYYHIIQHLRSLVFLATNERHSW